METLPNADGALNDGTFGGGSSRAALGATVVVGFRNVGADF